MAASPWDFFTLEELRCSHCGEMHVDDGFMRKLVAARRELGFPFPITSGYRCPAHNAAVSRTGETGPHTTGRAVDIAINRGQAFALITNAERYGFTGLGVSQKGATRFVHLDDLPDAPGRPRPTVWSY